MEKIVVVGAGRVGESTAQILAQQELCQEVVLIDVNEGVAEGGALDIQESAPIFGFDTRLSGSSDPAAMQGAEVVIHTAGLPRKPGMSRSDVLEANINITTTIINNVIKHAPNAMLIIVSNPVDVLTYHAWKMTGWDRSRVFGQAGVLDATRMASFVAMETGLSAKDISALVLGGHGDTMVPMPRYTCVNGIPISQFLDKDTIDQIIDRTRKGGAEILALKQNSSAYGSPAAAVAAMVDAICHNRKRVLPCVTILQGEYDEDDVAMGVPVMLGSRGLEQVVELPLNDEELAQFKGSVQYIRDDIAKIPKQN